jgi:integrase
MSRALEKIGIQRRLTTHGLRRTFNSLALQVAPAETVRKVIGHADSSMTLHYLHVDLDQRARLGASVFDNVLEAEVEGR